MITVMLTRVATYDTVIGYREFGVFAGIRGGELAGVSLLFTDKRSTVRKASTWADVGCYHFQPNPEETRNFYEFLNTVLFS